MEKPIEVGDEVYCEFAHLHGLTSVDNIVKVKVNLFSHDRKMALVEILNMLGNLDCPAEMIVESRFLNREYTEPVTSHALCVGDLVIHVAGGKPSSMGVVTHVSHSMANFLTGTGEMRKGKMDNMMIVSKKVTQ